MTEKPSGKKTSVPRYVELIRTGVGGPAGQAAVDSQRAALDRLRDIRPGVCVARIDAVGISGAQPIDQRPDLLQLGILARTKAFTEVRVQSVERLTRDKDPGMRFAILAILQDAGAIVIDSGGSVFRVALSLAWESALPADLVTAMRRRSAHGRAMDRAMKPASPARGKSSRQK